MRVLKSGGALPEVVRYAQDEFKCEECEATIRLPTRRRVAVPMPFSFNRVLSIDTFFVTLGNLQIQIQCIIWQGTHYMELSIVYSRHLLDQEEADNRQGREVTPGNPSSWDSWNTFLQPWVKCFYLLRAVLADDGI